MVPTRQLETQDRTRCAAGDAVVRQSAALAWIHDTPTSFATGIPAMGRRFTHNATSSWSSHRLNRQILSLHQIRDRWPLGCVVGTRQRSPGPTNRDGAIRSCQYHSAIHWPADQPFLSAIHWTMKSGTCVPLKRRVEFASKCSTPMS